MDTGLDALLAANARYAAETATDLSGFDPADGSARAGVAIVTCMDARIDIAAAFGLRVGDAVVLRNPGGQVDDTTLAGLVLGVRLLGVRRILIIRHTRCAMAADEALLRGRLVDAGTDAAAADGLVLAVIADQETSLRADVATVRTAPALAGTDVSVHGLVYDVETRLVSAQT